MKVFTVNFFPVDPAVFSTVHTFYSNQSHYLSSAGDKNIRHLITVRKQLPGNNPRDRIYFRGGKGFFYLPLRLFFFIFRHAPDVLILHSFAFPFQVFLLRAFISSKTALIIQHHAERPLNNRLKRWIQRMAYSGAHAYLFAGAGLAEPFIKAGIITKRSSVTEVMEDSTGFKPGDKSASRLKLNITGDPLILWVGRLNQNKDPLTVLEGFRRYAVLNSGAKLYMIFSEDSLLSEVEEFISSRTLQQQVILVGKVEHSLMEDWYRAADVFISGSHYEGSGYALCEAMACGCFPVVTSIPSFATMTGGGACAFLFQPGDPDDLFSKLSLLSGTDKDVMKQMVIDQFNKELSFAAIENKYTALLEKLKV